MKISAHQEKKKNEEKKRAREEQKKRKRTSDRFYRSCVLLFCGRLESSTAKK